MSWVWPPPRMPVTTGIIIYLGSGIPINLHLALLLGGGHTQNMSGNTKQAPIKLDDWEIIGTADEHLEKKASKSPSVRALMVQPFLAEARVRRFKFSNQLLEGVVRLKAMIDPCVNTRIRIRIRPKKLYARQMSPCEWRRFLFEGAVSCSENRGRLGGGDAGEALDTGYVWSCRPRSALVKNFPRWIQARHCNPMQGLSGKCLSSMA